MQHKNITEGYIKDFLSLFNQIPHLVDDLIQQIGLHQEDKAKLRRSVIEEDPAVLVGTTEATSTANRHEQYTVTKYAEIPLFSSRTAVPGLNVHLKSPMLFHCLPPEFLAEHTVRTVSSYYGEQLREPNEAAIDERFRPSLSKHKAKEIINRIYDMTQQQVSILLIGDIEDINSRHRSFDIYNTADKFIYQDFENDSGMLRFNISKKTLGTEENFEIYSVKDKNKGDIKLTGQGMNRLFEIYSNTLGNKDADNQPDPKPLLVYCEEEPDTAHKFIFALYLFSHFDEIFLKSKVREEVNARILDAFDTLRKSISPVALSNLVELHQAFYLAFAMMIVKLEKESIFQLDEYLASEVSTKGYDSISPALRRLSAAAKGKLPATQDRGVEPPPATGPRLAIVGDLEVGKVISTLDKELVYIPEVYSQHNALKRHIGLRSYIPFYSAVSSTPHFDRAVTIQAALSTRRTIETKICYPKTKLGVELRFEDAEELRAQAALN